MKKRTRGQTGGKEKRNVGSRGRKIKNRKKGEKEWRRTEERLKNMKVKQKERGKEVEAGMRKGKKR